jgi:4-amino-4-deoxy-L-arabinose transferase-like glycosyltransferase
LLQRAVLILVLAASTALYMFGLDRAPVYLGGDEAHFAIGGHAIAATGRNVNGDSLPLFFNLEDPLGDPVPMPWGETWYHPYLFYLIALTLKVLPFSEAAVRVPNAIIGGLITPWRHGACGSASPAPWRRRLPSHSRQRTSS